MVHRQMIHDLVQAVEGLVAHLLGRRLVGVDPLAGHVLFERLAQVAVAAVRPRHRAHVPVHVVVELLARRELLELLGAVHRAEPHLAVHRRVLLLVQAGQHHGRVVVRESRRGEHTVMLLRQVVTAERAQRASHVVTPQEKVSGRVRAHVAVHAVVADGHAHAVAVLVLVLHARLCGGHARAEHKSNRAVAGLHKRTYHWFRVHVHPGGGGEAGRAPQIAGRGTRRRLVTRAHAAGEVTTRSARHRTQQDTAPLRYHNTRSSDGRVRRRRCPLQQRHRVRFVLSQLEAGSRSADRPAAR